MGFKIVFTKPAVADLDLERAHDAGLPTGRAGQRRRVDEVVGGAPVAARKRLDPARREWTAAEVTGGRLACDQRRRRDAGLLQEAPCLLQPEPQQRRRQEERDDGRQREHEVGEEKGLAGRGEEDTTHAATEEGRRGQEGKEQEAS